MTRCPECSTALKQDDINCPSCGASLTIAQPTVKQPSPAASGSQRKSSNSATSTSSGQGSFISGTVLDGRYRIVALLGRGGMGEVYKAEDLKLDHVVALKFLPDSVGKDDAALTRFRTEVRIARQVTHQNVCRVFDIGEFEGRHFLTMEYIDGEDLSSLLRRIGRLPADKALEVSRQICAGLAAAHGAGVLHRDLKPANVMIDGRGKARITDFGIAGLEEDLKKGGVIAGTPAYMSPEQITGKEITVQSDIYSLGLVLYELFTGKAAVQSDSIQELVRKHKTVTPTNPSEILKEIDPLVEKTILRCLEKDPQQRPASALQVAAMLPGGDPLQAALAMGETPSPEMVAAAGEKTGLRPMIAVACLLSVIAGLVGLAFLGRRVSLIERIPFEHSPEVLAGKGRETIAQLGYPERPLDSAHGMNYDFDYLRYIDKDTRPDRWRQVENARGAAVYFWYRESPNDLQLTETSSTGRPSWTVSYSDPPPLVPGMKGAKLDTLGRLREFYARLPEVEEAKPSEAYIPPAAAPALAGQTTAVQASGTAVESPPPDWNRLFILAGLDQSRFTPGEALWNPESVTDARAAWTGTAADMPEVPIRVEAAAYRGKVVFFKLISPWTQPRQLQGGRRPLFFILFPVSLVIGAVLLAVRNYRKGKGDLQGAIRLVVFLFVAHQLYWLLTASHVPSTDELGLFGQALTRALFACALVWTLYIALEPYVRRRWPTTLITWSRVLAGKITDPLVGRDLLIGILLGVCYVLLRQLPPLIASRPWATVDLDHLLGVRFSVAEFFSAPTGAAIFACVVTFLLTLLRALLRRDWLAAAVVILFAALPDLLSGSLSRAVVGLILGSLIVLAFMRFGLLTVAASFVISFWLNGRPFTTNLSAWYASNQLLVLFMVTVLAALAFYTSLGGQKVFKGNLLED